MEKDRLTIVMDTSLVMRLKCNKLWMLVPPIIRNIIALSICTYYVHMYMAVQVSTHNMVNILLVYAFNNILWDFFLSQNLCLCWIKYLQYILCIPQRLKSTIFETFPSLYSSTLCKLLRKFSVPIKLKCCWFYFLRFLLELIKIPVQYASLKYHWSWPYPSYFLKKIF